MKSKWQFFRVGEKYFIMVKDLKGAFQDDIENFGDLLDPLEWRKKV